ncbi:MAG: hypothetical protein IJ503_09010 [Akkermansia sp.]|nr:hypothetical protein [Akkermansia sp.]
MKRIGIALALLGLISAASADAASPERAKAMELSAPGSKSSLGSICLAVYKAVKAEPARASEIFGEVISQRTTWKVSETSAIFRAVLMARPDLGAAWGQFVRANRGAKLNRYGKDGKGGAVNAPGLPREINEMLNYLYNASLEDGVPEDTFNELINPPAELPYIPVAPPTPINVIVTPGDMSPAN